MKIFIGLKIHGGLIQKQEEHGWMQFDIFYEDVFMI